MYACIYTHTHTHTHTHIYILKTGHYTKKFFHVKTDPSASVQKETGHTHTHTTRSTPQTLSALNRSYALTPPTNTNTNEQHGQRRGLKVPCAPKLFSSSFSYPPCTNDFGAATHNERRFQFRLGQSRVPSLSGIHG